MKKLLQILSCALASLAFVQTADAQDMSDVPNIAAIGVGTLPDYLGSEDYTYGAAPLLRLKFGNTERFLGVYGNLARINVLDHPNWRVGPAGVLRFKRGNVDDDAVDAMENIAMTGELGGYLGYDFSAGTDPRDRWNFAVQLTHDVGGVHDGYVGTGGVTRWFGVGRAGLFGLNTGFTYGSNGFNEEYFSVTREDSIRSGLKQYDADAGFRDVRVAAMFIQPLNRRWAIGAGAMYQRLVGDAADSPVTDRGSKDQFVAGFGLGRMW